MSSCWAVSTLRPQSSGLGFTECQFKSTFLPHFPTKNPAKNPPHPCRKSAKVCAEVSTVIRKPRGGFVNKKPSMIVDAITVEKGKYGYEIESCINSLSQLPPRGSVTRCMDLYRNKLAMNDFATIFREFAQRGDWHRGLRLFKYMQRQQWCKPTEHIYTIMIGIMGREGLLEKCAEIFEDMPKNGIPWNVYSFTALINAYGRNGHYETSLKLLAKMKAEKIEPSIVTYNTVLNACCKGGFEWEGLLNIFAQMRHDAVHPDLITYNTLLSACATRGLVEQAGMMFKTMNEAGIIPDETSYDSLITTFSNANRLKGIEDIFEEMEKQGNLPDITGYNNLIEAYGKINNTKGAAEIFKRMQKARVDPDITTYSSLLEVYGRQGSFEEVRQLFADMKELDATPDISTYNTLIGMFGRGGHFKESVELFDDLLDAGVSADSATYSELLSVCGRAGLTKEAAKIHRHMLSRNIPAVGDMPAAEDIPTNILPSFRGLISAYITAGMYEEAMVTFNTIEESRLKPDGSIYDVLIDGYAKGGMHVEAGSLFYEMIQAGHEPSVCTYNSLIEAYSKAGLYESALLFVDDMQLTKRMPDERTHLVLLGTYCGMGLFDEAKAQFLELKESAKVPEPAAYCFMLSICARRTKWDYASQLLNEMQKMPGLHSVVAGILHGKYDKDYNWQIVEHAFDALKLEDLLDSMTFYSALLEALVYFNQKQRAARVLQDALRRGAYPEAYKKTSTVWSVNIQRMSSGAAVTALNIWFSDMQGLATKDEKLPFMTSIVICCGNLEEHRKVEELPGAKVVLAYLKFYNAPYESASWNEGRLLCKGELLKLWLTELPSVVDTFLTNQPLPVSNSKMTATVSA